MSKNGHIASNRSATLQYNGVVHQINSDHPNFAKAVAALKRDQYAAAELLMKPIEAIKNIGYGFTVRHNQVFWFDDLVHNLVCDRIVENIADGHDVKNLVNFLRKLQTNPSYNSQQELYKFLEVNDLPITPDGDFIAYKLINADWTDTYSGTISNRVGEQPRMPRSAVDDDSSKTCSRGLHVCGFRYLRNYSGARLVAVAVNPQDVVSVPHDYNGSKMRCCAYTVTDELDLSNIRKGYDVLREERRYVINEGIGEELNEDEWGDEQEDTDRDHYWD